MPKRTQFLICPLCTQRARQKEIDGRVKNDGIIKIRKYLCFNCNRTFITIEKVLVPISNKEREKKINEFKEKIYDINSRMGNSQRTQAWIKHEIKEMAKKGIKTVEKPKDDGWEEPKQEFVQERAFKFKKKD